MTYEQFEEIVAEAIEAHISRDKTIVTADRVWEIENAARAIATKLR